MGHKGLQMEEGLIFEQSGEGRCGVDLPEPPQVPERLGGLARKANIGLPGLSEPQVVRHYTRLSQKNYAIDSGLYPLGSCTMKHNPRLNEKLARLPGFADIHPLQPESTVQGALELIDTLAHWLKTLTGMPAVAMSLAAGAHGELCGLMAIRSALEARGDARKRVLVPDSAHGTNPATAATCGYQVQSIPSNDRGRVDLDALKAALDDDVAAFMLTNPNTCGLFEDQIIEQAEAIHDAGALFYCDGANFNAIAGIARPGDLGIDCMHMNLHKTFSYAPLPWVVHGDDGFSLVEHATQIGDGASPFGRMKGFHGQFGMFVRALAYMMSHGADGLRQASSDAVLSANYVLARLKDTLSLPYDGPCMHEVLFDDRFLDGSDITTLDYAKALIDEGYHPMTIYFPLVVHGALLVEPTESESRQSLDHFIGTLETLGKRAKSGDADFFHDAPKHTPRRRLDETAAARQPVLRWRDDGNVAAE
jgi:glycine dehydrogenase subunit 2